MSLITIPNNHVAVKPLDTEVRLLLEPYLRQCPFRAERTEDLHSTIAYTQTSIPTELVDPAAVYTGVITGAQIWFDKYLGIKDMVILLDSPSLVDRHNKLLSLSGAESVYDDYVPHITIAYDIPNSSSRYRWWINDVIERFATRYKGTVIRFSGEYIEDSAGNVEPRGKELLPVKPVL